MVELCCEIHPFGEPGQFLPLEFEPADVLQTEYGWELKRSGWVCPQCQAEDFKEEMRLLRGTAGESDMEAVA